MTVRDDLVQSAGGHEKDELQSSIHLRDREPAYSTKGEIFEVLIETQGDMLVADNLDALHAKRLFEETEGIDIDPESAVTFAALLKAAWYDGIEKEALVLLNVTGAGRYRQQLDKELISARLALEIDEKEIALDKTLVRIAGLFG
jgi:cysteate synthase